MRLPGQPAPRRDPGTAPEPARAPLAAQAEAEADRAAHAVLQASQPLGPALAAAVPGQAARTAPIPGIGRPLDPARRRFFSRRLGADLAAVRVHEDAAAAGAADAQHAHGYTVGEHVVLGAEAGDEVLAHELVHVLQQRRGGRTAVQRQDRPRRGGPGRTPPEVDFETATERAFGEDAHVLFPQDSITLTGVDLTGSLPELAEATGPVTVHVHGYASTEGDTEYNLNLSAHRAAAIRALLLPLLPEGSEVRLYAHGSTAEFGDDPATNRRVGIRVESGQATQVPPGLTWPGLRSRRWFPELELRLDPDVIPPLPSTVVIPGVTGPWWRPGQPAGQLPPALAPWVSAEPSPPDPFRPDLFPQLNPWDVVDFGALRQTFVDHGAGAIDAGTAAAAASHTYDWYLRYRAMGFSHETARSMANFGTRVLVGGELERQGNTVIDRTNNELRRAGQPTPLGGSVDLLELWRKLRD